MAKKKSEFNLKLWIPIIAVALIIVVSLGVLLGSSTRVAFLNIEEGSVEVDTGKGWVKAQDGMDLSKEDKVRTLEGKAVLILHESILVQLDENTEVSIEDLSKKNVKLSQSSGSTWNKFMSIAGIQNFEVETPTTVATVRGTSFWVDMESVGVSDGNVDVRMGGKKMNVKPGFKAVEDGVKVIPVSEQEKQMMIARKQIIVKHLKNLRQMEIEKHKTTYNMVKAVKGWTDSDVNRYMNRLDRGEFNEDEIKKKMILPAKSVDKFAQITKEIRKQNEEISQIQGRGFASYDGVDGESRGYDGVDGESRNVMDDGEHGDRMMPPDPLDHELREREMVNLDRKGGDIQMPPDPLN